MNAYSSSESNFARSIENAIDQAHAEIRHAVAYADRVIVPQVRRESSAALRSLASHLERLADSLHRNETPIS